MINANNSLASLFDDSNNPGKPQQEHNEIPEPAPQPAQPQQFQQDTEDQQPDPGFIETALQASQTEQLTDTSPITPTGATFSTTPNPAVTPHPHNNGAVFDNFDMDMPMPQTNRHKGFVLPWKRKALERQETERLIKLPTRTVKTVLVANTKGGSGKTPLAVMLAAAFGQVGGKQPVLIDNNPTGNLARRVNQMPPSALTIDDLAVNLEELENDPNRIRDYLVWQADSYHVLPARPRKLIELPDGTQALDRPTISQEEAAGVWNFCSQVSRLLIVDSGNNDADDAWRGMLPYADQLVVPVRWSSDFCKAAFEMLRTLEATGYGQLARNAIIVQTAPNDAYSKKRSRWAENFNRVGLEVVGVPADPHLALNKNIVWDMLKQNTRDAVCELAANISARLAS